MDCICSSSTLDKDLKDLPADNFGLIVDKLRFGLELVEYLNQFPDRKAIGKFWVNANPLIPGEHIFLAATNYGLSACWVGYLDTEQAATILNLPDDMVCLFLMPIGYPAVEPEKIHRKSYNEMVFYEKW